MTDDENPGPNRLATGTSVLTLSGELDYDRGDEVSAQVDSAFAARPPVLVVDLSRVTFADSFALRLLIIAHRRMRTGGGLLVLAGPLTEAVSRLLEATATDRYFTLAPDLPEAERMAAAFRSPPATDTGPA
ncbi:STAS domain-containing protein [Kitasatospora sp. NPDC101801]|uniref:STAS domain-containing protein n=1 Tax=Kitasatospora sp. NPDC101801 TaxID=3364103 RepID=UPI003809C6B9